MKKKLNFDKLMQLMESDSFSASQGYGLLNEGFGDEVEDTEEGLDEFNTEDEAPEEEGDDFEDAFADEDIAEGDDEVTITLPREQAQALYDALGAMLGGGADDAEDIDIDVDAEDDGEGDEDLDVDIEDSDADEEEEDFDDIFDEDEEITISPEEGTPTRKRANTSYTNKGTVDGTIYGQVNQGQATPATPDGKTTRTRANTTYTNKGTVDGCDYGKVGNTMFNL